MVEVPHDSRSKPRVSETQASDVARHCGCCITELRLLAWRAHLVEASRQIRPIKPGRSSGSDTRAVRTVHQTNGEEFIVTVDTEVRPVDLWIMQQKSQH